MALYYVNVISVCVSVLPTIFTFDHSQIDGYAGKLDLSTNCTLALKQFSEAMVDFTRCSLAHSRPIHLCMNCANEHTASVNSYQNFKKQDTECEEFFFGSDQLFVIDVIYNGGNDLWEKSNCQNCYDHYPETERFFQSSADLVDCMQNSNHTTMTSPNSTCEKCHEPYANLSASYNKFVLWKEEFNGGICMDIIDTMNISRRLWTENKCLVTFNTNIGFPNVLTALIIGVSPVMFYLLAANVSRLEDVKLVRPKRKFTPQTVQEQ